MGADINVLTSSPVPSASDSHLGWGQVGAMSSAGGILSPVPRLRLRQWSRDSDPEKKPRPPQGYSWRVTQVFSSAPEQ